MQVTSFVYLPAASGILWQTPEVFKACLTQTLKPRVSSFLTSLLRASAPSEAPSSTFKVEKLVLGRPFDVSKSPTRCARRSPSLISCLCQLLGCWVGAGM